MAGKKAKRGAPWAAINARKKQLADRRAGLEGQPQQPTFTHIVSKTQNIEDLADARAAAIGSAAMGPPPRPARTLRPKLKEYPFGTGMNTIMGVGTDIPSAREDMARTHKRLAAASTIVADRVLAHNPEYNNMPPEVAAAFKRQEQRRNGTFKKISFLAPNGELVEGHQRVQGGMDLTSSMSSQPVQQERTYGGPYHHLYASHHEDQYGYGHPNYDEAAMDAPGSPYGTQSAHSGQSSSSSQDVYSPHAYSTYPFQIPLGFENANAVGYQAPVGYGDVAATGTQSAQYHYHVPTASSNSQFGYQTPVSYESMAATANQSAQAHYYVPTTSYHVSTAPSSSQLGYPSQFAQVSAPMSYVRDSPYTQPPGQTQGAGQGAYNTAYQATYPPPHGMEGGVDDEVMWYQKGNPERGAKKADPEKRSALDVVSGGRPPAIRDWVMPRQPSWSPITPEQRKVDTVPVPATERAKTAPTDGLVNNIGVGKKYDSIIITGKKAVIPAEENANAFPRQNSLIDELMWARELFAKRK